MRGGGLYHCGSDISLKNCIFVDNYATEGGAAYVEHPLSSIDNCVFNRNCAEHGGALYLRYFWLSKLANCIFIANTARYGGGMYSDQSGPTLTNCTFSGNSATEDGGAMYIGEDASATLTNCILWADMPQEIHMHLLSGVSVATYSNIQGGWPGVTNTTVDPCFADPGYWDANGTPEEPNDDFWVDGDYHLKSQAGRWDANEGRWTKDELTSPCIDAGDMSSAIGFEPFPNGGVVNMGAYGGTAEASKSYFGEPVCESIIAGDINGDCTVNFKDFALMAFHWLEDNNR
jgi:predicted outer membrane repeat protein